MKKSKINKLVSNIKLKKHPPIPAKLFADIIKSIQDQDIIANAVDMGIRAINTSYTVVQLDKYVRNMLKEIVVEHYGHIIWDWIEWWLYDTRGKGGKCTHNNKSYNVNSVKKLYNFIYKNEKDGTL